MLLSLSRRATASWPSVSQASRRVRRSHLKNGRSLVTLAIETSCDDTSVAVAEAPTELSSVKVLFHEKITANNDAFRGIHPLVALHSHQTSLAPLIQTALQTCPKPNLVAATRGPGMRSNLSVGLDTAKGLALAWNVPFIGIHHMQAHALTPRLVSALRDKRHESHILAPRFPFLTVLASGGHTMLMHSTGLVDHSILAETQDIALGDCLDKAARAILPSDALTSPFGKALEAFAFPNGDADYKYEPPARREDELQAHQTRWEWSLRPPLAESKGGLKSSRRMVFSFAGLLTSVERIMRRTTAFDPGSDRGTMTSGVSLEERRDLARELLRVAFEHLASRIFIHLATVDATQIETLVISGGVASNSFLRHVLRSILDARGFTHIQLACPPVSLCTDNALMIAWTAMEMWHAGYHSSLSIEPIRKWSMDASATDGGILGAGGWVQNR